VAQLFPATVYLLCFATSSACAWLLARTYHQTRARLLLWSAICFVFLAANNLVVIVDLLLVADTDYRLLRLFLSLIALCVLLFGFVWDSESEA